MHMKVIPPSPPSPFECHLANGIRIMVKDAGFDPESLPSNLASRLSEPDIIPEYIWSYFSQEFRIDQAREIYWLYQFMCYKWASTAVFDPCNLLVYLPSELVGKQQLRLFVQYMDDMGYLRQIGLNGGRTVVDGRVIYPYVEQVYDEEIDRFIRRYGLADEVKLQQFILTLGQRYPHLPPDAVKVLSNPGMVYWITDQVESLNPGVGIIRPELALDID